MNLPYSYEEYIKWKMSGNSFDSGIFLDFDNEEIDKWIVDNLLWMTDNNVVSNVRFTSGSITGYYDSIELHVDGFAYYIDDDDTHYDELLNFLTSKDIL